MEISIKTLYFGSLFFLICLMFIARIGFYILAKYMKNRQSIHNLLILYNIALYTMIGTMLLMTVYYE